MPRIKSSVNDTSKEDASKRKRNQYFKPNSKRKKRVTSHDQILPKKEEHGLPPDKDNDVSSSQNEVDYVDSYDDQAEITTTSQTTKNDSSLQTSELTNSTLARNRHLQVHLSRSSEISSLTNSCLASTHQRTEGMKFSHRNFISEHALILSTHFTFEDCNKLRQLKGAKQVKGRIPQEVIENSLRKLNHKFDDEIQKYLNRQFRRKILIELFDAEQKLSAENDKENEVKRYPKESMEISEILEICSEEWDCDGQEIDGAYLRRYSNALADLIQIDHELTEVKQNVLSYEVKCNQIINLRQLKVCNGSTSPVISEVEFLANDANSATLKKGLSRTNELVQQIVEILEEKQS